MKDIWRLSKYFDASTFHRLQRGILSVNDAGDCSKHWSLLLLLLPTFMLVATFMLLLTIIGESWTLTVSLAKFNGGDFSVWRIWSLSWLGLREGSTNTLRREWFRITHCSISRWSWRTLPWKKRVCLETWIRWYFSIFCLISNTVSQ